MVKRLLRRLRSLITHRRDDADLARELASHLALLEDEYRRRGMTADEALFAARRAMGSVALAQDLHHDARSFVWLEDLLRDLRHAVRSLRRAPGFTVVAVFTLGLGIGVNTAFFTIVNAICLRGVPIVAPERVLTIGARDAAGRPAGGLSYPEFEGLRAAQTSFERVAAYMSRPVTIADEGRPADRVMGAHISAGAFELLGEVPILGRGFQADDDRSGASPVVVIGASLWRSRYADDPGIIGRRILVNGNPATIVGVMREGFAFLQNTELWQPIAALDDGSITRRDVRPLFVFGRLAAPVGVDRARAEMETLSGIWARDFPDSNRGMSARVVPINEQMSGNIADRTWLSFITAGVLVLLIACANVANLLLMRGALRGREVAIRTSIGATRGRLVRQLLIESTLLALLGAATGLVVAVSSLRWLSAMVPAGALQYWMTFTIDSRVLFVVALASAGSVLVCGLAPALHLVRGNVSQAIKDSGRTTDGGVPARRWTTTFLAIEFALTLVLIALVVTGVRQTWASQRAEFPFDAAPILSMWITLPGQPGATTESRQAFSNRLIESFAAIPGVSSVSIASALPRVGGPAMTLEIAGDRPAPDGASPRVTVIDVSPGYFDTLRVPLVRGRAFTTADGDPGSAVAIVNRRAADMFFGDRDPVGQLIRLTRAGAPAPGPWARVVGMSPVVRQATSGIEPDPVVYVPHRMSSQSGAAILVRGEGAPDRLAPLVRQALHDLDPNLPLYRAMPLQQAMDEAGWNGRVAAVMAQSIAAIALFMALVGLYAVTAYAVRWWHPNLALRIALGARAGNIAWLVLRRVLTQLSIGLVLGLVAAQAFDRLLNAPVTQAEAVQMNDAGVLALIVLSIAAVAVVACLAPIRRATRVDPLVALRSE